MHIRSKCLFRAILSAQMHVAPLSTHAAHSSFPESAATPRRQWHRWFRDANRISAFVAMRSDAKMPNESFC